MAELIVTPNGGDAQTYPMLLDAHVEIFHGQPDEPVEMRPAPVVQFRVKIALDALPVLSSWALAPAGEKRFAKVELTTFDRERVIARKWTLEKAYLHHYQEIEFPAELPSAATAENVYEMVIRGTIVNNAAFDGKNLATMVPKKS